MLNMEQKKHHFKHIKLIVNIQLLLLSSYSVQKNVHLKSLSSQFILFLRY